MIFEVHICVSEDIEEVVSDFLMEHGSMGIVTDISNGREKPLVKGYFQDPDREKIALGLQLLSMAAGDAFSDISISWLSIEEKDWANAWKEHAKPVATGQRLLILPSWLESDSNLQRMVIRMDPEMAFGSGSHETTRGCLEALEKIANNRSLGHVLDMGTGSGILAIGASMLGADLVTAIDNDPIAVETARKNCQLNKVDSNISIKRAETPPPGEFSTIVANILAEVLVNIQTSLVSALAPGGSLVLSGILDEQACEVIDAYTKCGLLKTDTLAMGEWVTLVFTKQE
jgi:ribosomal protein L11 methyltransferase